MFLDEILEDVIYCIRSKINKQNSKNEAIKIWTAETAPDFIKSIVGDEDYDWVAFIPRCYGNSGIRLFESNYFGKITVKEYTCDDGIIRIGYNY